MFLADLHLHTKYSDGNLSIRELVDLMGQHGMGAIAITDHLCEEKTFLGKSARLLSRTLTKHTFNEYMEEIKTEAVRAWEQYRMLVIPGVEITKNSFSHKNSAHILAIDIQEFIQPDLSIEEVIAEVHRQGGLAVAAHPVNTGRIESQTYQLWNDREKFASLFDAWEVASGSILFPEVRDSGLPIIATSDLHRPQQIESWKTAFTSEKTSASIKQAIRQQDLEIQYYQPAMAHSNIRETFSRRLAPAISKRA
jgi:histidinol phosphatase-like PHP family hydrolase